MSPFKSACLYTTFSHIISSISLLTRTLHNSRVLFFYLFILPYSI
nr:MAG TPA: hypothetical protein [Caudoviricetes sp.]